MNTLLLMPGLVAAMLAADPAEEHVLENRALRVEVNVREGAVTVVDRRTGRRWAQATPGAVADVLVPTASVPPRIDGRLEEWTRAPLIRLTPTMTADSRKVDNDADASAEIWAQWDDAFLYVAARMRDDRLDFGPWEGLWWQRDSFEFWVGDEFVPIELNPKAPRLVSGYERLRAMVAMSTQEHGYAVEVAVPWSSLAKAARPVAGERFRFAVGVNDADGTGERQGQLYFPPTRRHANASTYAWAALAGTTGEVPPPPSPTARFRNVSANGTMLSFEADFGKGDDQPHNTFRVALELVGQEPDLRVTMESPHPEQPMGPAPFLAGFVLDSLNGVAVMADYSNGHLYPLNESPFPRPYQGLCIYDMPWVGLSDLKTGEGYALLVETPEDADLAFEPVSTTTGKTHIPRVVWLPVGGTTSFPRRMTYHFVKEGGYVALARYYRGYAVSKGLLRTLEDKARDNPRVARLFGAADVWGAPDIAQFAREAKAAGLERLLIQVGGHQRPSREALDVVEKLGYLSGQYDNYTDAMPSADGTVDFQHDLMPERSAMDAQGNRIGGWVTLDGQKFYKRCPAWWLPAARGTVPAILDQHPFTSRFIDVTTAEGLYECFDPAHPVSRVDKRVISEELLDYMVTQGLVVGGEHGKYWAARHLAYLEGIMSAYYWFWPAGHLIRPLRKDQVYDNVPVYPLYDWETYAKWDIGHRYRAPLWELAFHEAVVTTWYWGDSNLWLHDAAPEVTPKKELFNLLYGTMPMFWHDDWVNRKELMLRLCRTICPWHEVVAGAALVEHRFLSDDHALQYSRFANGAEMYVNFGAESRTVKLASVEYLLPEHGFTGRAGDVELHRTIQGARAVTTVETPTFLYTDEPGVGVAMRKVGENEIRVWVESSREPVAVPIARLGKDWNLAHLTVVKLDATGETETPLDVTTTTDALLLPAENAFASYRVGKGAR